MASETKKYYDELKKKDYPKYRRTRLAQQKRYNEKGSSKPGTKNITGRKITIAANKLRNQLKLPVGDKRDACHTKSGGEACSRKKNRSRKA